MRLNTTIKALDRASNRSKKKGFKGDEANYSFQSHVLKLLKGLGKFKEEEETTTSQESGMQRFLCTSCKGKGYTELWNSEEDLKAVEFKEIRDCDDCKGEGYIELEVKDKRKVSKNRVLEYSETY